MLRDYFATAQEWRLDRFLLSPLISTHCIRNSFRVAPRGSRSVHSAAFRELQPMAATKRAEAGWHRQHIERTESTDETDSASIELIEPSASLYREYSDLGNLMILLI